MPKKSQEPPAATPKPVPPRRSGIWGSLAFVLIMILVGTNASTLLLFLDRADNPPAQESTPAPANAGDSVQVVATSETSGEQTRPPFKVVNMHEHLYRLQDLDKYLRAAQVTGIASTAFVASSNATHLGAKGKIDEGNEWNTEEILRAKQQFSDDVIPFCTIYPADPDKLQKLRDYVGRGAKGLKLFSGHSQFHERPLDDPSMLPIYEYCEEIGLPICWHIRLEAFYQEFLNVMQKFPNLKVILPHFGVTFYQPTTGFPLLGALMDNYPNIYTDTSFGTRAILVHGLEIFSADPDFFRAFFERYQDRIVFGTDMVVTGNREKTQVWVESVIRACRQVLERDKYTFFMAAEGSGYHYPPAHNTYGELRGLNLSNDILKKIYETNPEKLFASK